LSTFTRLLIALIPALIISACDTIPVRGDRDDDDPDAGQAPSSVEAIPLEHSEWEPIEPLEPEPDPGEAIRASLEEALVAQPPQRQTAYLDASRGLIDSGRFESAEAILDQVIVSGLPPVHFARKRLQQAAIFFHREELQRAQRYVEAGLRRRNIDPLYTARGLDLKARIELAREQPLEAARTWVRRHDYLVEDQAVARNNERIWHALGKLDALALQVAGQSEAGDALRRWLDLAILVLELSGDQHALQTAVAQWSRANRGQPAARFGETLLPPERAPGLRRIALLLPLSSQFGAAARMIHDGFDAAQVMDKHPDRPQFVLYDIGAEPSLAGNYVGVATAEGADVIVGPLGKSAVTALLETRRPERPMVLLGGASLDRPLAAGGYPFDLAPELEARQVAEFMHAAGHRRVGVLRPNDEWGQRIHDAFLDRWERLGGSIVETRPYRPGADDHTASIKGLFNLAESETRKALLEARGGLKLNFEARRRRDIDALFMAARTDDARLLKPQINFYQGHDLPVYSTSHVYSGAPDKVNDADLEGIVFPGMPWVVRDTTRARKLANAIRDLGFQNMDSGLFAYGYDAYHLALLAARPDPARDNRLRGLTSTFVFDGDGRLQRQPQWARFRDGVPVITWGH